MDSLYKHNYSSLSHLFMTTIRDYQHIQQIFRNILEKNMQTELTVLETYTQIPIDSVYISSSLYHPLGNIVQPSNVTSRILLFILWTRLLPRPLIMRYERLIWLYKTNIVYSHSFSFFQ